MRGPRAIPDSEFRWESIQQVAREMGLKLDPALVIRIDAAGWSMKDGYHPMAPEIGYKPMQALLEKTRDFTAVFCFNDIAAIGAIRALKDAGLSVPRETFPWSASTTSSPRPTPRPRSPPSASRC
jgi:DNA-binding LacI/PurR family transcriptional regulator